MCMCMYVTAVGVAAHAVRLARPFVITSENLEIAFCAVRRRQTRLASPFYVASRVMIAIHA